MNDEYWYVPNKHGPVGPVSVEFLRRILAEQKNWHDLPVWKEGFDGWKKASEVEELRSALVPPPFILPDRKGPPPFILPERKGPPPYEPEPASLEPTTAERSNISEDGVPIGPATQPATQHDLLKRPTRLISSRKTVIATLTAYLLIALAFGAWISLTYPAAPSCPLRCVLGRTVGHALGILVLTGIVPMIVWAFGRFRKENASAPLITWVILGLGFMGLSAFGIIVHDRKENIVRAAQSNVARPGPFVRGFIASCVKSQKANQLNQKLGITDKQIKNYCTCSAQAVAKQMTEEEMLDFGKSGRMPRSTQAKAYSVELDCRRSALGH